MTGWHMDLSVKTVRSHWGPLMRETTWSATAFEMSSIKLKYPRTKTELYFQPPVPPCGENNTSARMGQHCHAQGGDQVLWGLASPGDSSWSLTVVTFHAGAPETSPFLRCAGQLHEAPSHMLLVKAVMCLRVWRWWKAGGVPACLCFSCSLYHLVTER